ncbi:hypothetical protein EYC84_003288 [Monilinia fructicola]|uniref:Uncharacterized protein n=1 Tax=Monilinia fructicola TaxID=38448 RepID=A0A5M9JVI7_MONFR|nr:hypothetical protein EYC84_003288 [Monilinia fructicola]
MKSFTPYANSLVLSQTYLRTWLSSINPLPPATRFFKFNLCLGNHHHSFLLPRKSIAKSSAVPGPNLLSPLDLYFELSIAQIVLADCHSMVVNLSNLHVTEKDICSLPAKSLFLSFEASELRCLDPHHHPTLQD